MTSCVPALAANSVCTNVLTWTTAFVDSSYTIQCSLTTPSTIGTTVLASVLFAASKTASGASVVVTNGANGGTLTSASLECTAVHD